VEQVRTGSGKIGCFYSGLNRSLSKVGWGGHLASIEKGATGDPACSFVSVLKGLNKQ
jgi:hypothetical protein